MTSTLAKDCEDSAVNETLTEKTPDTQAAFALAPFKQRSEHAGGVENQTDLDLHDADSPRSVHNNIPALLKPYIVRMNQMASNAAMLAM